MGDGDMGDFQGEAWDQRANTQVTYGHCFSVTEWADALTEEKICVDFISGSRQACFWLSP